MEQLILSQGYIAIVDSIDFKRASKYKWHAEISRDKLRVYARTDIGGKKVRLHRFIMRAKPGQLVDHKGGNETSLDCRRQNLRFIDKSGNAANSKMNKRNTSGYRGVSFHPQTGKWRASLVIGGKRQSLGLFKSATEASKVVEYKRKQQWG